MTEFLLTVCISNHNTSKFTLNTLYCLDKLTKNKYKVIIRDNDSKMKDYLRLRKKIKQYQNVELYRIENFPYSGGMAHGMSLNDLISKIDTKYGAVLDSDCSFLYKNWDEILINEINEQYPIIGTQAPVGSIKPQDFPYIFAFLFITDIMKRLKIDFRPRDIKNLEDTGFELRKKYLENGYKGKILLMKNTRNYKLGSFHKVLCAEYYLKGINKIFASHFGRGHTLGRAKYMKGWKVRVYGFPFAGKFLLRARGKKERKRWIKICKKIVDKN